MTGSDSDSDSNSNRPYRPARGGWPAWRFAGRLARREVRRRPGRTLLVMALVAVPVFGMTFGSVVGRALHESQKVDAYWPAGADLMASQSGRHDVDSLDSAPDLQVLATVRAADWAPIVEVDGSVETGVRVSAAGLGVADPQNAIEDGGWPGEGQVWLTADLARRFGVRIGDTLELQRPAGTWTVSGLGRRRRTSSEPAMQFAVLPAGEFRPDVLTESTYIAVVGADPHDDGAALERAVRAFPPESVVTADGFGDDGFGTSLAWGWVAGAIALAAMGLIIAAAFATSSRRQLATIGLLSANGSSPAVTSRMLALQGLWTGAIGSFAGAAAAVTLALTGRSVIGRVIGGDLVGMRVAWPDVVVIVLTGTVAATLAALVPARSASRVPVMMALSGRRPVRPVPRRLVPIGLGLFGGGVLLVAVAAASSDQAGNLIAIVAIIGGLLVIAGACCATPLAVDVASRIGARLGGSWRIAARSLARTRSRTAAVVTAIAVAAGLTVAGSGAAASQRPSDDFPTQTLADAAVFVRPSEAWGETGGVLATDWRDPLPVAAEVRDRVGQVLPSARWYPLRVVRWDLPPANYDADAGWSVNPWWFDSVIVADDATMDLYGLNDRERAAVRDVGALVLNNYDIFDVDPRHPTVVVPTAAGDVMLPVALRDHVREQYRMARDAPFGMEVEAAIPPEGYGTDALMLTEQAARRAGFDVVERGGFIRNDGPIDNEVLSTLSLMWQDSSYLSTYYTAYSRATSSYSMTWGWTPGEQFSARLAQSLVVAASLVVTLVIVAIALALAAAEGKDERDVFVAVGARPQTLRSMAASKAVVMTFTGIAVAIPAGLVPTAVAFRAADHPFHVPWWALGLLVGVVPLVAGLSALGGSAIGQRLRPVRMSTLATD